MSQIIECILDHNKDANEATIILKSLEGERRHTFTLPWLDDKEWNAVFGYLKAYRKFSDTWPKNPKTVELAKNLGLANDDGSPLTSRVKKIGEQLYRTVFGDEKIRGIFQQSLRNSKQRPPVIVLHITDKGRYLQTYPWEVLHDGEDFLFDSDRACLVRWIDFGKPIQPLHIGGELNVLLVDPRPEMPKEYDELPLSLDKDILKEYLVAVSNKLIVHDLETTLFPMSTLVKVNDLSSKEIQVIHIDVHGDFGKLCDKCGYLNTHKKAEYCQGCEKPIAKHQYPQGYLALQDDKDRLVWKSGEALGKAINKDNVNLVVLSACNSGLVAGGTIFNSVAGALIKQGVPAVIAMQFPIEVESTKLFVYSLYNALLNKEPLTKALATARTKLSVDYEDAWYRPAVYLRTDYTNIQGEIFKPELSFPSPRINVGKKEQLGYQWDIFLSHKHEGSCFEKWIYNVFLEDLQRYLEQDLLRKPKIFQPRKELVSSSERDLQIKYALLHSRCFIAICSPQYFQTRQCRYELSVMLQRIRRTGHNDLLILIKAHDGNSFPNAVKEMNLFDCCEYTRKNLPMSPRYVDFQDLIVNLSERIAQTIMNPPQWNEAFNEDIDHPEASLIDSLKPSSYSFEIPRHSVSKWER